ncbi:hypothetical protein BC939DRAFT_503881 [Gamsiella multidivaricata]|uniref:uncharacterized protein n=1 Tax=Gamsiella multidivaricata TaxID=101098 RepID=UPI00221E751A|nr:uncharacterized protein BC939DRAFT_503881 [Gamsiella multidivaricata]KAG0368960.1 hypothetical protein BGZ54_000707 [Gamsiella multidivaricata]KAI7822377.1 hypothetical protein BC939DRAFT_503881 [Gamsiella multidivaricata]
MTKAQPPKVLIAGGGISGLFLALLLERQNVPYMVYERASEIKSLGSAMGFGANILPAFEQLGLLEELMAISLPCRRLEMLDKELNFMSGIDFSEYKERTGYDTVMFTRPSLHRLLYSHVPPEKVLLSKRVLSLEQNDLGVMVRMADGSTYHGDILVGADGAYSGVRQGLYKHLEKCGNLPLSDMEELNMGHLCMVGTTDPLDPEKYPCIKSGISSFQRVINNGDPYTWHTVNMRDNRLCWGIIVQIESGSASRDAMFRNSEWGSDADDSLMQKTYEYTTPVGGVIRDLINATPKENMSKTFLEEKLFETWYHGRTVLIGDACHKFLPSAGQGAVNAMQDAVVLANCIYEMGEATPQNITAAFREYYAERHAPVKRMMNKSAIMAAIQYGQTWKERVIRHVIFNWIPKKVQTGQFFKDATYRPQAAFLNYVENRGSDPVLPQKPSKRCAEEKAAHKKAA